ncbi:MAG TPA: glycosyltransferase [Tepidiformaceae bacterium]|nr:glycosyltransferase [Tepidiformaceae bacterium]
MPTLRKLGLRIATEGDQPAQLAFAMSGRVATEAWEFSRRRRSRLLVYIWDLPPEGTGRGRPDPAFWLGGHFLRMPRPWGGYRRLRGHYSRLYYIACRADAVWVPSASTQATVAERFGLRAHRIPYCYDSGRFVAVPRADNSGAVSLTLLTVSRLRPHKNQAAVLHAAAILGRGARVRLIGQGPDHQALRRLAEGLHVPCVIDAATDDEEVARAYRECSVVVAPSRFEGFGLTPIEGVASGARVVASDIPPHREFVGGVARLAPPDDHGALARAALEALEASPPDPSSVRDLTIAAAAERFCGALQVLVN